MPRKGETCTETHSRVLTEAQLIEGQAMRDKGESWYKIADHLGVQRRTLCYNLCPGEAERHRLRARERTRLNPKTRKYQQATCYAKHAVRNREYASNYRKTHRKPRTAVAKPNPFNRCAFIPPERVNYRSRVHAIRAAIRRYRGLAVLAGIIREDNYAAR